MCVTDRDRNHHGNVTDHDRHLSNTSSPYPLSQTVTDILATNRHLILDMAMEISKAVPKIPAKSNSTRELKVLVSGPSFLLTVMYYN
jgi:hypothetical protein